MKIFTVPTSDGSFSIIEINDGDISTGTGKRFRRIGTDPSTFAAIIGIG